MRKSVPSVGCLLLLIISGCASKLNDERTVQVGPAEEKTLLIDPSTREQKVKLTN